jgi:hypothetical protein
VYVWRFPDYGEIPRFDLMEFILKTRMEDKK